MSTAKLLSDKGYKIFRAGIWKPRTKPGGFEGNGEMALPWMKRVKDELGMLITTEVATPEHVELALKYGMDILWIGARTCGVAQCKLWRILCRVWMCPCWLKTL